MRSRWPSSRRTRPSTAARRRSPSPVRSRAGTGSPGHRWVNVSGGVTDTAARTAAPLLRPCRSRRRKQPRSTGPPAVRPALPLRRDTWFRCARRLPSRLDEDQGVPMQESGRRFELAVHFRKLAITMSTSRHGSSEGVGRAMPVHQGGRRRHSQGARARGARAGMPVRAGPPDGRQPPSAAGPGRIAR
jgi:hypothetical protein